MVGSTSFARLLTPSSLVRYVLWKLTGRTRTVALRLHGGPVIMLRPPSTGNNDYGVAYEIFCHRYYDSPRPLMADTIARIVDLGANVGFSCLYWLTKFPGAEIIALEPHPGHAAQCRRNLAANANSGRVELHEAAAGALRQEIRLSDAGTSSTVVADARGDIAAEMVDVFALLDGRRVDLMKLDIEGGEFAILEDARFPAMRIPYVTMEWHGEPADKERCLSRFRALNYDTVELFDNGSHGMLWAFHRQPATVAR